MVRSCWVIDHMNVELDSDVPGRETGVVAAGLIVELAVDGEVAAAGVVCRAHHSFDYEFI